MARRRHEGHEV